MFGALDNLFANTNVDPKDVGILVVNCSIFCPTPSLSAMIVNKYKLTEVTSGHSTSAEWVAAPELSGWILLKTCCCYIGTRTQLLSRQRTLLSTGISVTTSPCWYRTACFESVALRFCCRTSLGTRDGLSTGSCMSSGLTVEQTTKLSLRLSTGEDDTGKKGVFLSKDLMAIAGETLKTNFTTLGPLVLPVSEQILYFTTLLAKKLFNEKGLQLSPVHAEPARMTLHRFGNTSSSSTWYELAYIEAKGRMRRGDRVWQIAFGSGFKCNSAVWEALRNVKPSKNNPWEACVDKYPVTLRY
ncbi:unnamed protein product [Microthlaspi erraticum]|uniref:FAE domain-containing protein n=1 Tax=Microthlaspi erraticum TaxID=1685480 RepID=A0A6D2L955_9BRAS|nr:unnamed protein product [Microthlaspi erraticum]